MADLHTAETICTLAAPQKQWGKQLGHCGILYLYGMTGFGKTTQAIAFAAAQYKEWQRFSAAEDGFWQGTTDWLAAHKKLRSKALLILDDLQWLQEPAAQQRLFALLLASRQTRGLHMMLISRAALPAYLSPLWATQQMTVETAEALRLGKEQVKELLQTIPALSALPGERQQAITEACLQAAKGYAVGVVAYLHRAAEPPQNIAAAATVTALATGDVYDYLDAHLMRQWTPSRVSAALRLSVYPHFTLEMARLLLGEDARAILQDFLAVGSFLRFTAPDTYTFAPFFWCYLEKKLLSAPETEWKPLYAIAAGCYEQQRDLEQALRCYKQAGRTDKIAELVVYLSENAEGCAFARIAAQYMDTLPPEYEQRDPRILGAKAMLCAYRMQTDECTAYLEQLRQLAESEHKYVLRGDALATYVRTVIACPYDTADELKSNLFKFVDYAVHHGPYLPNIMPTGNLPSLINGGLDLLPWESAKAALYPAIKKASEKIMGPEAVGIADASMGEILYEQNQKTKAMAALTKAYSAAELNGTIRVQYAANGIMARLFQSEAQEDTAESILRNTATKARQQHYLELLPNIEASLALCALLKNDGAAYTQWLQTAAPDEHAEFYITERYRLIVKARVYTALGRELDALYILGILEQYAQLYRRTYLNIEILTLKAIILYRRGEDWQQELQQAVAMAQPYGLIRIFADQGAALLPLLQGWDPAAQGEPFPQKYIAAIKKECRQMAETYPGYLQPPRRFGALSDKEQAVLKLMAQGLNNSQIAAELGISLGTAKFHVKNIMQKLQAENRTVAVKVAQEEGLL